MQFKFAKQTPQSPLSGAFRIIMMVLIVVVMLWLANHMFFSQVDTGWKKKTEKLKAAAQDLSLRKRWNLPPEVLHNIKDGTNLDLFTKKFVDGAEYKICAELMLTPDAALDASTLLDVKHGDILAEPDKFRGKIISLISEIAEPAKQINLPKDQENPIALYSLYDVKIRDKSGNIFTLLSIQAPSAEENKPGATVQVTGVFYKNLPIDPEGKIVAPMLIVPHIKPALRIKQNFIDHIITDIVAKNVGLPIERHFNYTFPPEKEKVEFVEDPTIFETVIDNYYLRSQKKTPDAEDTQIRGVLPQGRNEMIRAGMEIEAEPLYYLIKKCITKTQEEISKELDKSVTYRKLITDSEMYRGKVVHMRGKLIDLEMRQLSTGNTNDTGMYSILRGYLLNAEGEIVIFECVDKDIAKKLALKKGSSISFDGYFLKNWASPDRSKRTQKMLRWYPFLVVKTIEKNIFVQEKHSGKTLLAVFIVVVLILLLIIFALQKRWSKRDDLQQRAMLRGKSARRQRKSPPSDLSAEEPKPSAEEQEDKK